jgi:putative membrane protein
MARPFLTDATKQALSGAVRAVESSSSAELVIAVRPSSGYYLHADLITGLAAAFAVLAFLLFSPWAFGLAWFVIDPLIAAALGALVSSRSPALRRALTPAAVRRRQVERAARATFVERRVHGTSGRTGILLYISLLERDAAQVVDLGVEAVAATASWREAVGGIEEDVRRGEDGAAVARRIEALAALLAPALARAADDVDELANEIDEAPEGHKR